VNHSSVLRVRELVDPASTRLNVLALASQLSVALETWRRQLPQDIRRARARGFLAFAVDLERLYQQVTTLSTLCGRYVQSAPPE